MRFGVHRKKHGSHELTSEESTCYRFPPYPVVIENKLKFEYPRVNEYWHCGEHSYIANYEKSIYLFELELSPYLYKRLCDSEYLDFSYMPYAEVLCILEGRYDYAFRRMKKRNIAIVKNEIRRVLEMRLTPFAPDKSGDGSAAPAFSETLSTTAPEAEQ